MSRTRAFRAARSARRARRVGIAALLLAAGVGCATDSGQYRFQMPAVEPAGAASRLWPAAPAVPRYAFIGHLYGESNRGGAAAPRAGLARLFAALVGLDARRRETTDLVRPQQISGDGNGRLYVTDPGRQSVFVFDEALGEFMLWNERNQDLPLPSPIGVTVADDSVWVTDSELALIYRLGADGSLLGRYRHPLLQRPTGIAYDAPRRRIFVSDTAAGNIKLFDLGGRLLATWGEPGSGAGQFNRPTYLAYRQRRLYVADSLNARIQVFDQDGEFVQSIGRRGLYVGNFARPKGIALDSDGNLYVTESYYDHLLIYDADGRLLMSIGGSGRAAGQFSQPTGVWVDARDRVFVSDMLNGRVSMFQYLGDN